MLITKEHFDKSLEIISQFNEVAIDCETFWVDSWENKRIIGVSVYGEIEGKYFNGYYPFRHDWEGTENLPLDSLERLTESLEMVALHCFHNAKFDRSRFIREGLELTQPFFCTMVASHMVDENSSHVLEDLAEHYHIDPQANVRKHHIHEVRKQILWHKIPPNIMVPYACGDTHNTYKLKQKLVPILQKQELLELWSTEELYSDALMHMELNGVLIDPNFAEDLSFQASRRMCDIKKELGFDPAKAISLSQKLFKELGLPIYEFGKPAKSFPNGRPTMSEPILVRLHKEATNEAKVVMDLVLEYRGLQKARSTWYDGFPEKADSGNRIHATYNQHGTVTTRLSCVDPNMQQLPRDVESSPVKKMFRVTPSYELWEFDYNQLEYRLAGALSNDPIILDAYKSGSDMHQLTANRLGFTRQNSKTINFLFIYQGGPNRYSDTFGVPIEQAQSVWNNYHQTYNVMFRYAARVNATAAQRGYIKLWDGRRRRFRFQFESKKAWNSLVQGGAALIMKHGIIRIHQDKTLQSKLVGTVHDSVWMEIPEQLVHIESAKVREHLEWPSRDPRFRIPFPVEMKRLA